MGEGDNGEQKGKGHQGTCIKDTWTKPKGVGWRVGGGGGQGVGGVVGEKWRQLYLNNNKKNKEKNKEMPAIVKKLWKD